MRPVQTFTELAEWLARGGQRSHRFQAEKPETFSDFAKAMAVAVLLVAAMYAAVLVLAAYGTGPR